MTTDHPPTFGLVLAGGLARRMGGGDKARIEIGGVSILDRVLATLSAQCTGMIINANGDPKRFADTGLTVVADSVPDFAGPLAGILAGLDWLAKQKNGIEWIVSVPGDCPFLPDDLVERLHQARRKMGAGVPLACARSGEWRHPVVGLWPLALREDLRRFRNNEPVQALAGTRAPTPPAANATATLPRTDEATPSRPSSSASSSRPGGMPGPSSRTVTTSASGVASSSTHAGAEGPTWATTLSRQAETTATISSASGFARSTPPEGAATETPRRRSSDDSSPTRSTTPGVGPTASC